MPDQAIAGSRSEPFDGHPRAGPSVAGLDELELDAVRRRGSLLRLRRRQRLAVGPTDSPLLYVVLKGSLFVELDIGTGRNQIVLLLLPGDIYHSRIVPPCAQCHLMAAGPAEIVRVNEQGLAAIEMDALLAPAALAEKTTGMLARALLLRACIGGLSGEERVATYLIEIGVRSGALEAGAASIDIPLSRKDAAHYLALNADTLSRIMTRLRARGAIGRASRGKLAIKSWDVLRELSPVAGILAPQPG